MLRLLNNYFRSNVMSQLIYEDIWTCYAPGVIKALNNNEYVKKDMVLYDKMIDRYINLHTSRKNNIIKRYDFFLASNIFFVNSLAFEGLIIQFIDISYIDFNHIGIMVGMTLPIVMVYASADFLKKSLSSKTIDEYMKMKEEVSKHLEEENE